MSKSLRNMIMASILIAVGITLPMAFHTIQGAGRIFLPMHIPILLCGLLLGWKYGLAVGILTPLLSHFFTGMPPGPMLPGMLFELTAYGAAAGLLTQIVRTKNTCANIYIALIGAMLIGRILMGILNALIFSVGEYSVQVWLTASFAAALPGIAIQVVLIPIIVLALNKALKNGKSQY